MPRKDIKQVRDACRRHGLTPDEELAFGDYIHKLKDTGSGGTGPNGDFAPDELDEAVRDFRDLSRQ